MILIHLAPRRRRKKIFESTEKRKLDDVLLPLSKCKYAKINMAVRSCLGSLLPSLIADRPIRY